MSVLGSAILLAVVVKTILDYLAEPLQRKYPQLDLWWFNYVAFAAGLVAAWCANINLFSAYFPNEILGRVLTACAVGGGAKMLNDIFGSAEGALPFLSGFAGSAAESDMARSEVCRPRIRGW